MKQFYYAQMHIHNFCDPAGTYVYIIHISKQKKPNLCDAST